MLLCLKDATVVALVGDAVALVGDAVAMVEDAVGSTVVADIAASTVVGDEAFIVFAWGLDEKKTQMRGAMEFFYDT